MKVESNKSSVSVLVINFALFFSLFAFSSFNYNLHSVSQDSTQTELVLSKDFKKDRFLLSFHNFCIEFINVEIPSFLLGSQHLAQFVYNNCVQVKYLYFSKNILSYKSSFLFLHSRIYEPRSQDEIWDILFG